MGKIFHNVDVNSQVLFNETVLNIIRNFIPHETVTFDDRHPLWITSRIKKMINDKNLVFERFVYKKGFVNNSSNLDRFGSLQNKLSSLIETSKIIFLKSCKKVTLSQYQLKTLLVYFQKFFNE